MAWRGFIHRPDEYEREDPPVDAGNTLELIREILNNHTIIRAMIQLPVDSLNQVERKTLLELSEAFPAAARPRRMAGVEVDDPVRRNSGRIFEDEPVRDNGTNRRRAGQDRLARFEMFLPNERTEPRHTSRPNNTPNKGRKRQIIEVDDDDSEEDNGRRPGPRRPGESHPWRRVLNLERVAMDPTSRDFFETYGTNAALFLSDGQQLEHEISEYDYDHRGAAYMACFKYVSALKSRTAIDQIRWCFSMLMYFDLVRIVRPETTGRRVTAGMYREIEEFLHRPVTTVTNKQNYQYLNRCSILGAKINGLCQDFGGVGVIFFLGHLLTDDFLFNHMVESGQNYHDVKHHLEDLNLRQKIRDSGATTLGRAIRTYLIRPFVRPAAAPAEIDER